MRTRSMSRQLAAVGRQVRIKNKKKLSNSFKKRVSNFCRCQVPQLDGNCYRLPPANEFLDYPRCCSNYECKSSKANDKTNTEETRLYDHYGRLIREHITQRVKVLIKDPPTTTTFNYAPGSNTRVSTATINN